MSRPTATPGGYLPSSQSATLCRAYCDYLFDFLDLLFLKANGQGLFELPPRFGRGPLLTRYPHRPHIIPPGINIPLGAGGKWRLAWTDNMGYRSRVLWVVIKRVVFYVFSPGWYVPYRTYGYHRRKACLIWANTILIWNTCFTCLIWVTLLSLR